MRRALSGNESGTFVQQAADVLGDLRIAIAEILPDGTRTASDLRKLANVDYRLAWQVHKFVSSQDPLTSSTYLPTQAAFTRFIKARRTAVASPLVDRAVQAFGVYQELVKTNAGDRNSFDSMVSSAGANANNDVDLQHRRMAYQSNSHLMGVQIKCNYAGHFIHAGPDGKTLTHAEIIGPIGFRRMRSDATIALSNTTNPNDVNANITTQLTREPLDPDGVLPEGLSVLSAFSTSPLPAVTTQRRNKKWIRTMLVGADVGTKSDLTVLLGSITHGIPREGFLDSGVLSTSHVARYPMEMLTIDTFMHRSVTQFGPPTIYVMYDAYAIGAHPNEMHELADKLPARGEVTMPPPGPPLLHCAEVPRYAEMIRYCCEKMGWDVADFALYRYQLRYPILATLVELTFPMLKAE